MFRLVVHDHDILRDHGIKHLDIKPLKDHGILKVKSPKRSLV